MEIFCLACAIITVLVLKLEANNFYHGVFDPEHTPKLHLLRDKTT